jgi:uncharacterized protein involved in exopolysaccharide biosynthesis/Mrp family chromosome partitioning ATPase
MASVRGEEFDSQQNRNDRAIIELPSGWSHERRETSLRDLLSVIFRHKFMVVSIFLATVISTCLWLWIGGDTYETAARVMIRFSRDDADPKTSLSAANTRLIPANRPDINTEAELIKSYALVDKVVTTLHLDYPPLATPPPGLLPRIKFELRQAYHALRDFVDDVQIAAGLKERLTNREKIIVEIMQGLKVESVKDSSIVKVSLDMSIKAGAAKVLNTLLDFYREHRLAVGQNPREAEFFSSQAAQYDQALRSKEEELHNLKNKFDISSFPDQVRLMLDNVSNSERTAKAAAAKLAATEAKAKILAAQIAREEPDRVVSKIDSRNSEMDFLSEKQGALELELQRLLSKYDEHSVSVQDVKDQLARVKQLIAETSATVPQSRTVAPNATLESLQKEYLAAGEEAAGLRAEYNSEVATVAQYKSQLHRLQNAEVAYNQLARDVSVGEETYRLNEKNALESQSAEALNSKGITSIEVVDPAEDPILPSGIRKSYLLGGSVLLGLILALGLTFIADAVDHSVRTPEDVEKYSGYRVYGCLNFLKSRRGLFPPQGAMLDQLMEIASKLDSAVIGERRIITFASASRRAGASTVAAGVAWALSAGLSKKVLLLTPSRDGVTAPKFPSPSLSLHQELDSLKSDWPGNIVEVGQNLGLVASRFNPLDVTSAQVSERIRVLSQALSTYEYILIDADSSLGYHQRMGALLSGAGVVLVVEADRTRREVLERRNNEFARDGVHVLGAVLNKRKFPIPSIIYKLV